MKFWENIENGLFKKRYKKYTQLYLSHQIGGVKQWIYANVGTNIIDDNTIDNDTIPY